MQNIDWDKMAAPWLKYEAQLEAAHQSVFDSLMQRANLKEGQRVLDIGYGAGKSLLAAAEAVGPQGTVIGVDIAPPLAARAQERVPENVTARIDDAAEMTFDTPFDAAISLFGSMFFADTTAAFANIKAAIKPGANMTFAAWGPPAENPWFGTPRSVFEAHLGPLPKPDPTAPGPFRFANAPATCAQIEASGLDISYETEDLHLHTGQDAAAIAEMQLSIMGGSMLAGVELSDVDRSVLQSNLRDALIQFQSDDEVVVPAQVHFFTATAP